MAWASAPEDEDKVPFGIQVWQGPPVQAPINAGVAMTNTLQVDVYKVDTQSPELYELDGGSTVSNLKAKIRVTEQLPSKAEVLIFQRNAIPGNVSRLLNNTDLLSKYDRKQFVYHVRGVATDLRALVNCSCNQNIVFIGLPGHGKSSLINTIAKSLGCRSAITMTFRGAVTGTMVYTPHHFNQQGLSFTLWDVPGQAISNIGQNGLQKILKNILSGYQPPNNQINTGIRWFSRRTECIHAVVCVQNGTVDTLHGMHFTILNTARELGRGVPVYMVMTFCDILIAERQMTPVAMEQKRRDLATYLGVDPSVVFSIANYDYETDYHREDPQRDEYTRSMLLDILSAAKHYKEEIESDNCLLM
ncbi:uncharacterized protein LOC144444772 [Glandiceps talaboti]